MSLIFILNLPTFLSQIINVHPNLISILLAIIILLISLRLLTRKYDRIFLVDFSCYKPPESQKCSPQTILDQAKKQGIFSNDSLSFLAKTLPLSSLGDSTYLPQNILSVPPNLTIEAARNESEMVIFGAIDWVLAKTKVELISEIGVLIVNCTVFNPIPSLTSIIVNRYKLREDICSYNVSGMGCSSSLLATGLAKQILEVRQNTCALVISSENTTSSVYAGADISKLIVNCVCRSGGSAALLSNKPSHRHRSKYELLHTLRTHTASSDLAYRCLHREEDSDGITGITTTKNLLIAATSAIEQHLQLLGFLILPLPEKLKLLLPGKFVPKFNQCADHFLPHVGVQDAVRRKLGFDMEASRMTLHRFGNTSNSSIWYELAYVEAKGRVRKGDRVWQIAYGSGFKCSSLIMRALRDVESDDMNPWMTHIHAYPLDLDDSFPLPYLFESPKM